MKRRVHGLDLDFESCFVLFDSCSYALRSLELIELVLRFEVFGGMVGEGRKGGVT